MTTPLLALSLLALGPLLVESAAPSDPASQVGGDKKKVQGPGTGAKEAERHARELEAIAQRLEEVAASAAAAAEDARARATRARNRADALNAGRPAEPPRIGDGDGGFGPVAPPRPGADKGGTDERPPVFRRQDPGDAQPPKAPTRAPLLP